MVALPVSSKRRREHGSHHPDRDDTDARIMALAERQHGIVSRRQLVVSGVPAHAIEYRVKKGRLQTLHRGVYGVGPVAAVHAREMAALLACGEGALLSHRSAAEIWRLIRALQGPVVVHVTVVGGRHARGAGIRVHRVPFIPADEVTRCNGLPITVPARTLLDLAGWVDQDDLERALAHATRRGLTDRVMLELLCARYPRRRGTRQLRALLGEHRPALTRSEAEARFIALIRKVRLRTPETNVVVRGFEVDCLWRGERLVAEIDGFAFHSSPEAFERDRHRDAVLTAAGYRVIR